MTRFPGSPDPTDPVVMARRAAATRAFTERTHTLWHQYNGTDAPCERCGTARGTDAATRD